MTDKLEKAARESSKYTNPEDMTTMGAYRQGKFEGFLEGAQWGKPKWVDWTAKDGRTNSSDLFVELSNEF